MAPHLLYEHRRLFKYVLILNHNIVHRFRIEYVQSPGLLSMNQYTRRLNDTLHAWSHSEQSMDLDNRAKFIGDQAMKIPTIRVK